FPRTWVPIASIYELDPNRPTPQLFLNQQYVCYQDQPSGQWIIMDDICPHRLAPLSEGRINRNTETKISSIISTSLQCSYHGWEYDGLNNGKCIGIPQISEQEKTALLSSTSNSNRACVKSYSTIVHKNILWFWPWKVDSLSILGQHKKYPEGMMESISINAIPSTYTRDLPYGWDTLVENLIDPAHIPFAHHNLQGKRKDAIPIYMSIPESFSDTTVESFYFEWSDRTRGKHRGGTGEFNAPYGVSYNAHYYDTKEEMLEKREKDDAGFKLGALCIPTKPGWSRAIIMAGPKEMKEKEMKKKKEKRKSLFGILFSIIPVWAIHLLSNKFLDSDLSFLHYQEQERLRHIQDGRYDGGSNGYYMPAQSDRCISALRKWIPKYTNYLGDGSPSNNKYELPNTIPRKELFDRYVQHTSHCRHCQKGLKQIQTKIIPRLYGVMTISILASGFNLFRGYKLVTKLIALLSFGLIRLITAKIEPAFKDGEFKHYEN
ncbi:hypothetical protein FRACYDRAFT_137803, partial [Fragilariopsis cylindrus CCMP1102]